MNRLSIGPVLRGHWKGLSIDRGGSTSPDWITRGFLIIPAVALGGVAWRLGWTFSAGSALLTAVALMAGASLAVFAQLATLRARLTERQDEAWLETERDGIDESVAHLLVSFVLCVVTAGLLVAGLATAGISKETPAAQPVIETPWFPMIIGLSYYTAALLLVLVSKLYSGYVEANHVRRELNGFYRSHGGRSR